MSSKTKTLSIAGITGGVGSLTFVDLLLHLQKLSEEGKPPTTATYLYVGVMAFMFLSAFLSPSVLDIRNACLTQRRGEDSPTPQDQD
jgi:hypothetical protein